MNAIVSADGTKIAYDRAGDGPVVILVDGALCSRAQGPMPDLARELQSEFTVYNYDRRGRGDSGDSLQYAIAREVEDLAALIEEAGGTAYVYGTSSGAALALRAAAAGVPITKLAVFEAPFVVDDSRKPIPRTWVEDLRTLPPNDAIKYFFTKGIGLPGVFVTMMKLMPAWKPMKAIAHTLPYDAELLGDNCFGNPLDAEQWATRRSPYWWSAAARALPGCERRSRPSPQQSPARSTARSRARTT